MSDAPTPQQRSMAKKTYEAQDLIEKWMYRIDVHVLIRQIQNNIVDADEESEAFNFWCHCASVAESYVLLKRLDSILRYKHNVEDGE